jgi:Domain of unknown function (DUF4082)
VGGVTPILSAAALGTAVLGTVLGIGLVAVVSDPTVNDPNPVELGVKFSATSAGNIIGMLFYKGPQNTGTHTAELWNAAGTMLASATFANETASGWQTVTFASPVAIAANTTYVATLHARRAVVTGHRHGRSGRRLSPSRA